MNSIISNADVYLGCQMKMVIWESRNLVQISPEVNADANCKYSDFDSPEAEIRGVICRIRSDLIRTRMKKKGLTFLFMVRMYG